MSEPTASSTTVADPAAADTIRRDALRRWCAEANYTDDLDDEPGYVSPHVEAFYGGFDSARAALVSERDALQAALLLYWISVGYVEWWDAAQKGQIRAALAAAGDPPQEEASDG